MYPILTHLLAVFQAPAFVVIHKYVRIPKVCYSCGDWECAYNGGQALPDFHELHRLPNSRRHLWITTRAGAWERVKNKYHKNNLPFIGN
jgi:hypothetical protein